MPKYVSISRYNDIIELSKNVLPVFVLKQKRLLRIVCRGKSHICIELHKFVSYTMNFILVNCT